MSPAWITFFASLTYGFPSVILYFITAFIVIKYPKSFNSSFFVLYIYDGVMNIFTYSLGFFTMRLSSITCRDCFFAPLYENIGKYVSLKFIMAMGFHMAYVQYSITTLISLNRLSVLFNYNLLEPLWKKYTWVFIVFIYFLPFLNTHIVFNYETKVVYSEDSQCYILMSLNFPTLDISAVVIPFTVITILISVVVNIISVCIVRNLKSQVKNKAETNFLVIMSITCAVQLLGTMITVAYALFRTTPLIVFLRIALPYVSDGLSLVQPWLLICFSHAIRQQVKRMFGWEPKTRGPSSQLFVIRSITS